ncbi:MULTISPECIES: substrate-binding domain-containing protein [Pseudomonas]|uniref:Substrate-binding domain-containing protein n=1 Tax=Pseudomonas benzopyrenica TaxID=2993566 RepID=A0ABZ2FJK5_9PSED|nr:MULTISPECIES: substrate-binding domain-containing protein [unclassified Pseudomonas]NRH43106.1 sugar ABC transporter substrate-binding protein [Pseudomonas sp. MS15a(2019)]SEO97226.1 ribose transport system substrate-binding protein [Pseudomonas sp. Snoq117.2]
MFKPTLRLLAGFMLAATCVNVAQASAPLIGVLTSKRDNFRTALINNVEERARTLDADLFLENASSDSALQLRQYRNLIAARVDAVIVNLIDDSNTQEMLSLAMSSKVPLVFINYRPNVSPLPAYAGFVGSDEVEAATMQMEELARRAGYKGKVAILMGESHHPATKLRTESVEKVVAKYPDMQVVVKASANWQRSEATDLVMQWVNKGVAFDIVAANNDEMAIGAIRGLEKAGKPLAQYLVGGIDGTPDGLQEMRAGKLAVSVLQDAKGQGEGAVDMALRLANGPTSNTLTQVPFQLITPDNLASF